MPNMTIARNFKEYRKLIGLTQDSLAEHLGISRGEVNYYENGKRDIPVQIIESFSDIVGINPSDLLIEDLAERDINLVFAFRADDLLPKDLDSIASFKRIVKNYIKLQQLVNE